MNIIKVWKDSLGVLQPKQLKLFSLITLKAVGDLYVAWFTYFWWLALFFGACAGPEQICPLAGSILGTIVAWKLHYLGLVQFTLYLMARPSVGLKNFKYCTQFLPLRYSLVILGSFGIYGLVLYGIEGMVSGTLGVALGILSGLFFLFFLDSEGGIREGWASLVRACKMLWYNVPIFLTLLAGVQLVSFAGHGLFILLGRGSVAAVVLRIGYVLCVPVLVSIVTNLYITFVHEDFVRYFGEQRKGYHD